MDFSKVIPALKKLVKALAVIFKALCTPLYVVAKKAHAGEVVGMGELGFAVWRLLVWTSFLLCMTGSVGVPPLIATLFLLDVFILAVQMVFIASEVNQAQEA